MTKQNIEVTITDENLIPALGNLERAALAELESFLAAEPNAGIARAAELLRLLDQILSSVADPNGAILQQILRMCEPCPCGREGSVLAAAVYRAIEGGQVMRAPRAGRSDGCQETEGERHGDSQDRNPITEDSDSGRTTRGGRSHGN